MADDATGLSLIDRKVAELFALVTEALAGATHALLIDGAVAAQHVIDGDQAIDDLTREIVDLVWKKIESETALHAEMRVLVNLLLILPELERSADLAESIATRAVENIGMEMSLVSRGYIQRMSEVALEMWRATAVAYRKRSAEGVVLEEIDEEIDILHDRLTIEVAAETMTADIASEVTLIGRFYERLGDHAVNIARRIETFAHIES
jgi:phosphate transport system protein